MSRRMKAAEMLGPGTLLYVVVGSSIALGLVHRSPD